MHAWWDDGSVAVMQWCLHDKVHNIPCMCSSDYHQIFCTLHYRGQLLSSWSLTPANYHMLNCLRTQYCEILPWSLIILITRKPYSEVICILSCWPGQIFKCLCWRLVGCGCCDSDTPKYRAIITALPWLTLLHRFFLKFCKKICGKTTQESWNTTFYLVLYLYSLVVHFMFVVLLLIIVWALKPRSKHAQF